MPEHLEHVAIADIKGVPDIEFRTGTLTVVGGGNGSGKTSVLDGVRHVFVGGHDPGLIRAGAKRGTVTLTLSDGKTLKATITPKATTREVSTPDGAVMKSPQAFLDSLAASFSFDPLAFLAAAPKVRAKYLLEAMPITFTKEEVAAALAGTGAVISKDYTLEEMELLRKGHYDSRTGVNRAKEELAGAITTMRKVAGDDDPTDWAAEVKKRETALDAAKGILGEKKQNIHSRIASLTAEEGKVLDVRLAEAASALEEAKRIYTETAAAISRDRLAMEREAAAALTQKLEAIDSEFSPLVETAQTDLATAKEKAAAQLRAAGARDQIATYDAKLKELLSKSFALDAALERVDELKKRKLAELPIEGLTTHEGEVFFNGIAFDHLNTQQKYFLAIQIGALKLGALPLMVCDGAEVLDAENWKDFQEAAKEGGIQVIAARVNDGALSVSTV